MTLEKFMKEGRYLPEFMRDFHDQKDLFKTIDDVVTNARNKKKGREDYVLDNLPSWLIAHIYVVDFFLWWVARRGYTLQKSRARVDFLPLEIETNLDRFKKQKESGTLPSFYIEESEK